ncbi:MAG TPA: hypothetical protein VFV63_06390, partial [Ilumatobacteraceae bacterium]|nr:hypothetical protein [Ilumatobacteraceae bacterium]
MKATRRLNRLTGIHHEVIVIHRGATGSTSGFDLWRDLSEPQPLRTGTSPHRAKIGHDIMTVIDERVSSATRSALARDIFGHVIDGELTGAKSGA